MLDVPHLARLSRLCRGRPRQCVVSRRRVRFSLLVKISQASIRTYRYIPISAYIYKTYSGVAGRYVSLLRSSGSVVRISDGGCFFFGPFSSFYLLAPFATSVNICTMMIEVSSKLSSSQFDMHTECCCCCCCCSVSCYTAVAVAAAAVLLFPAAVRHRVPDGQICCWFIESDHSVLLLSNQT